MGGLVGCSSSKAPTSSETVAPVENAKAAEESDAPATPTPPLKVSKSDTPASNSASENAAQNFQPQKMVISIGLVSRDLGIPEERLRSQASMLANYLEANRNPSAYCSDEDDTTREKFCGLIEQIRTGKAGLAAASKNKASSGGRRVPVRPHHFEQQQGMGYARLMKSLSREPANRVLAWVPQMLERTSCPRNLSAAALRRLESSLPSTQVKVAMERLYLHASACLRPDEEGYEITHLRQALLRRLWGDANGARTAIERAALATDSNERSRVLYWAGRMQMVAKRRDTYWDQLIEEYPLSYHALEVWHQRSVDPFEIFSSRPNLKLSRKIAGPADDVDTSLRWLEMLYIIGRVEPAHKLARWISRTYKDQLTPSHLLYISSLKSSQGTPLNTITFLTRQVSENPVLLNQQTLRMLFPKPYFDAFERASKKTDVFLVLALTRQESGFNPNARSPANARGLMQLLPSTARALTGRRPNLYDAETNMRIGEEFLSRLITKFSSVELALAAYNAGPGRIGEWKERYPTHEGMLFLDLIPFNETRNYVSSIVRNNYWYERLYRNDPSLQADQVAKTQSGLRSRLVSRLVASHISASQSNRAPASVADKLAAPGPQQDEDL